MKRGCHLCLNKYHYSMVKKYKHGLQLCGHCQDVLTELSLTVKSNLELF
jgi:hypothetical protein